jgi:high-affinity iron transporter
MLSSYLLSLREGLEMALIVGIVLGAVSKINRPQLRTIVWSGVLSAAVLSLAVGVLLTSLGTSLQGPAEPVYEGVTMFLAAGVLTWMIFWMSRQARHIKGNLESGVRKAALQNGNWALFLLAFIAVLREGIELALFLTAAVFATDTVQTLIGSALGLGTAILLGWTLVATTMRLDLRRFFQVTGILLILFAAGLVAHGVHELNEVGWIPAVIEHVWDTNAILSDTSLLGEVLKTLLGYNGNPSLTEVLAYAAYFVAIAIGLRLNSVKSIETSPNVS